LVKLYKDSVEDKIKENIAIGGQEWDSPIRAEVSSSSAVQEGTCDTNSLILLGKKKHIRTDPKPINNLFIFFQALK